MKIRMFSNQSILTIFLALFCRVALAVNPTNLFVWPVGVPTNGPFTSVSGATSNLVFSPNGNAPTENDLLSHRYHHHTRISYHAPTIYIASSSCGLGEGDEGMKVVCFISTNSGVTWTSPIEIVPSQTTWSTNHYVDGARIVYPRNWSYANGTNYMICAIDQYIDSGTHEQGMALVARAVFPDGTLGTIYQINTNTYTASNGIPTIEYSAGLRGILMDESKLIGTWGSGMAGEQREWRNYYFNGTFTLQEPSTFPSDTSGTNYFRLYRSYSGGTDANHVYQTYSTNSGVYFANANVTTIPDNPAETTGLRLSDGRFVIIGNPSYDVNNYRKILYFAMTDYDSTTITNVSTILTETQDPTYAGWSKLGGPAYPDAVQVGGEMYVSYSIHKESVGFSRFPIPSYTESNQPRFTLTANTLTIRR